jgi:hypothetical protein
MGLVVVGAVVMPLATLVGGVAVEVAMGVEDRAAVWGVIGPVLPPL